jgi:hypothetical protein
VSARGYLDGNRVTVAELGRFLSASARSTGQGLAGAHSCSAHAGSSGVSAMWLV